MVDERDPLRDDLEKAYGADLPGEDFDRDVLDKIERGAGGSREVAVEARFSIRRRILGLAAAAATILLAVFLVVQGAVQPEFAGERNGAVFGIVHGAGGARVFVSLKTWPEGKKTHLDLRGTVADAQGRFEITDVYRPGEKYAVNVTAHAPGFAFARRYFLKEEGAPLPEIELAPERSRPVRLLLLDSNGTPLPGAAVAPSEREEEDGPTHLVYGHAFEWLAENADDDGLITVDWFAEGDWAEVKAHVPGVGWRAARFELVGPLEDPLPVRFGAEAKREPARPMTALTDRDKRFLLHGPRDGVAEPADGYGLLLVLPGGDGGEDFATFGGRVYENCVRRDFLLAQLIAPKFTPSQEITWPTAGLPAPGMRFTTEEFVESVVTELRMRHRIDPDRILLLGWASGGPAAYAVGLDPDSSVRGTFAAMAVFHPRNLAPLGNAAGRAFVVHHSPDDEMVPIRFAEAARDALLESGAKVRYQTYRGGMGWHGDMYGDIRKGLLWLEQQTTGR